MKLIVEKKYNDWNFYDELLYISSKYPTLLKKPNTKAHKVTIVYAFYNLFAIFAVFLFLLFYLKTRKIIVLIILIQMIVLLLLSIYYYIDSFRFIKRELKREDETSITINKSGVRLTNGKLIDYNLEFKDIVHVIINKHTITFLPNSKRKLMIGFSSHYKKEIVKELKELKNDNLIVDNSDLYK